MYTFSHGAGWKFLINMLLNLFFFDLNYPFQISFINQTFLFNNDKTIMNFMLFTSLLSLGGLPPFLGFLPKWLIIQSMVINNMTFLVTIMVILSLITLYYYLRMSYSSLIILHSEPSWNIQIHKNKFLILTLLLSMISLFGLMMCTIVFVIY